MGIQVVKEEPASWQLSFTLRENRVPEEIYEVVPYFLIRHEPGRRSSSIVLEKMLRLCVQVISKIPFRRQKAFLEIN